MYILYTCLYTIYIYGDPMRPGVHFICMFICYIYGDPMRSRVHLVCMFICYICGDPMRSGVHLVYMFLRYITWRLFVPHLGISGSGVPSLRMKPPPALMTCLRCRLYSAWRDVVGVSLGAPSAFFRGANSSSLNTSHTAKLLSH